MSCLQSSHTLDSCPQYIRIGLVSFCELTFRKSAYADFHILFGVNSILPKLRRKLYYSAMCKRKSKGNFAHKLGESAKSDEQTQDDPMTEEQFLNKGLESSLAAKQQQKTTQQKTKEPEVAESNLVGPDDFSVTLGIAAGKMVIWVSNVPLISALTARLRGCLESASKFDRVMLCPFGLLINDLSAYQAMTVFQMISNDVRKIRGLNQEVKLPESVISALRTTAPAVVKLTNINAFLLKYAGSCSYTDGTAIYCATSPVCSPLQDPNPGVALDIDNLIGRANILGVIPPEQLRVSVHPSILLMLLGCHPDNINVDAAKNIVLFLAVGTVNDALRASMEPLREAYELQLSVGGETVYGEATVGLRRF